MPTPLYIDYQLPIDNHAQHIINTLHAYNYEAYLVGGAIRDLLQDKKPKDFDIVTNAIPEQIVKLFKFARIIGRRFQIVHVYSSKREFIEVTTFRGLESNTGMLKRDNTFGEMDTDASRRDFSINSLYYDTKNKRIIDWHDSLNDMEQKVIRPIGDPITRFTQDPVRMLRAIRFMNKLRFTLDERIVETTKTHKHLLQDIPPARLFEECIKLFSSTHAYSNYKALIECEIFPLLFPFTQDSVFIKKALLNTQERLREGLPSSPAFMFAVFLFAYYRSSFKTIAKTHKNKKKASERMMREVLSKQTKHVQIPQFALTKIINTWNLQYKLERANSNYSKILAYETLKEPDFRMAYDFLSIRSKVEPELTPSVEFWHKIQ